MEDGGQQVLVKDRLQPGVLVARHQACRLAAGTSSNVGVGAVAFEAAAAVVAFVVDATLSEDEAAQEEGEL